MSSAWTIEYSVRAQRQLKKLDRRVAQQIVSTLQRKLDDYGSPRLFGTAMVGEWTGYWRYRVGDYRVVCELHDRIVTVSVVELGHRSQVYR